MGLQIFPKTGIDGANMTFCEGRVFHSQESTKWQKADVSCVCE